MAQGLVRGSLAELADLVLGRACGGCGRPRTSWCPDCAHLLAAPPVRRPLLGPHDPASSPLWVWSTARYEDEVRTAVVAWKDRGRADLTSALVPALRRAVQAALAGVRAESPAAAGLPTAAGYLGEGLPVLLVPAPSSRRARRERGHDPVRDLARGCAAMVRRRGLDVRPVPALVHDRRVADQARLGARDRSRNLAGAVRVATSWAGEVEGRLCLLVDDVVTSGATLLECARALRHAGATVLGAATVAATPRRS